MKLLDAGVDGRIEARTRINLLLGLAALTGSLVVMGGFTNFVPTNYAGPVGSYHSGYVDSGRWLADARTLVAAVRYLLEAEPPARTNAGYPVFEVAMPTNMAAGLPKS